MQKQISLAEIFVRNEHLCTSPEKLCFFSLTFTGNIDRCYRCHVSIPSFLDEVGELEQTSRCNNNTIKHDFGMFYIICLQFLDSFTILIQFIGLASCHLCHFFDSKSFGVLLHCCFPFFPVFVFFFFRWGGGGGLVGFIYQNVSILCFFSKCPG